MAELECMDGQPLLSAVRLYEEGIMSLERELDTYSKLVVDCNERVQMIHSIAFNNEQCQYLVDTLKEVIESSNAFLKMSRGAFIGPNALTELENHLLSFKLLLVLATEIERYIEGCSKDAWVPTTMILTNVVEFVSSIGFHLELCRVALSKKCGARVGINLKQVADIGNNVNEIVKMKASMDKEGLLKKISLALPSLHGDEKDLAHYLLQRLLSVAPIPNIPSLVAKSDFSQYLSLLSSIFEKVKQGKSIGKGSSATVYKAMWMEMEVAVKVFYGESNLDFKTEVDILAGLCHPNITSMFCCTQERRKCSIVMELMDGDLFALIQQRLEVKHDSPPFNIWEAIDLMHQIAEGGKYLHEQDIVHRDLKSFNILVKSVKTMGVDLEPIQAKVADFNVSKIKKNSTTNSEQTKNVGSNRWMAPELIQLPSMGNEMNVGTSNQSEPKHPHKCDIYSFAMVCYEILTGELPFPAYSDDMPKKMKAMILKGDRPKLPGDCPSELRDLIEKCWDSEPKSRPTFDDVCWKLKYVKYLLMTGTSCASKIQDTIGKGQMERGSNPSLKNNSDRLEDIHKIDDRFSNTTIGKYVDALETVKEEHLPPQEGQQESKLSRFLSSLPKDERWFSKVDFEEDSKVVLNCGLPREFVLFLGTDLHRSHCEFLEAVASSKVVFCEGLEVNIREEESCKYMEAFCDALHQSNSDLRKIDIHCTSGFAIRFAKCVSSVVLGNDHIQDLHLGFFSGREVMGKVGVAEFMAIIASPYNLRILKSFYCYGMEFNGEGMEQLIKPFKSPHSVLEVLGFDSLTSDVQLEHISGMLATSTFLKTLLIYSSSRKVFTRGYTSLATALCSNQSLKTLRCKIHSSVELKALLDPLVPKNNNVQCNTTLTKLVLHENIGGKEGIETLVDMLCTNSSLLELELFQLKDLCADDPQGMENVLAILESLKTNKSLRRIGFSACSAVGGYKVLGAMMDLLLENHCIEDIDLKGTSMKKSGDAQHVSLALSKRKEIKLWDIVQGMANVNPTSGRVFLCGEPYAGKTRLRMSMKQWQKDQEKQKVQNTSRLRKGFKSAFKGFQAPKESPKEVLLERTHGIEVDKVLCDGIGITIWDMAGQTDYHSFQELVMPNLSADGSCSMFLLMCNPMETSNLFEARRLQSVKDELEYWLRFIASNTRRSHSYCPHVSIVMTHFDYWKDDLAFAACIEDVVKELKSQFEEVLAFDEDKVIFRVDGTDVSHACGVFDFIKSHLIDLLGRLPKTISACEEVQLRVAEWNANQSNPRLLKWDDFCASMCKDVKDFNCVDHELSKRRKVFVAISLNDGGHIIYNEKADVVITNPHWFCHDIIGQFLYQCGNTNKKLEMVSPNGIISIDHVKNFILDLIEDQGGADEKFDDILGMMKKLNICYEQDTMSIMIPSFLKNISGNLSWSRNDESSSFKYIGRRLACKDGMKKMLTPGFFTWLQISFFKMLPSHNGQDTYKVFSEVIKFISDGIEVILQFNDGDIDILLRSYQPQDQVLAFLRIHIIRRIRCLQEDPTLGCLGVRLIEYILRPECVEKLVSPKDRKNQYVHVKDLELEVVRSGLDATHIWKSCEGLGIGFNKVSTLLGGLAWKDLLERRSRDLQKYHKEVQSLGKLTRDGPSSSEDEKGDISTPTFWQMSRNLSYGPLDVKLDNIIRIQREYQEEVMSKLDDVMQSIHRLEHDIKSMQRELLHEVCSRMDDLLAFSIEMQKAQIPKVAYLCEIGSQKLLTRFVPGLDRVKLHLMCESMHGFHEVANQEGCMVNFGTNDTRRFLAMLAFGLKIATILTKIGAHVACGLGSMIPNFSNGCNFAALVLDTPGFLDYQIPRATLESFPTEERKFSRISIDDTLEAQQWMRGFLEPRCQNQREFHEKFRLNKVIYKRGSRSRAWICDKCKLEQHGELH